MLSKRYIDNPNAGQIHVVECGAGPTLFFIHQTPRSWDEFKEVIARLSADFHCVAIDLPGMGQSDEARPAPTIELYAEAVLTVIERIGKTPVTLCGHHTGGVVAIEAYAKRPDLIRSLVLSSTPWIDAPAREVRAKKTPIDSVTLAADGSHLIDLWQQRAPYYPKSAEYMNRFIADALKCANPASGHHAVSQYEMENRIGKIDCPVLLVEQMKDPFAAKHIGHMKAALSHSRLEQIPNGQVALEVTAEAFSKIIIDWMKT